MGGEEREGGGGGGGGGSLVWRVKSVEEIVA